MLVCDHKMRIRYVDVNNPGASHDSFIWNSSRLDTILLNEVGDRNTWLLGDAGYPLKPYLITPFRAHRDRGESSPERRFNDIHSKARNVIERTNGVLKNTFRCLLGTRQLHYTPEKASKIIKVCCALHNFRIQFNMENEAVNGIQDNAENLGLVLEDDADGFSIRRNIMNSIFNL